MSLEDLAFKGSSALALHRTPSSVPESGHPAPRRELTLNLTHWAAYELLFFVTFNTPSIETLRNEIFLCNVTNMFYLVALVRGEGGLRKSYPQTDPARSDRPKCVGYIILSVTIMRLLLELRSTSLCCDFHTCSIAALPVDSCAGEPLNRCEGQYLVLRPFFLSAPPFLLIPGVERK